MILLARPVVVEHVAPDGRPSGAGGDDSAVDAGGDDVPVGVGATRWVVVLPVKRLERAKTRVALPPRARADLALAMALDVAAAAASARCARAVVAVTDDARAARAMRGMGVTTVPDLPDGGLNPALAHAAEVVARRFPAAGVALVSSDVAAATPEELDAMLTAASRHDRAFLADAAGTGTTALTAAPGVRPEPAFGPGSAHRHRQGGAVPLDLDVPGLRADVDDLEGLRLLLTGRSPAPRTRAAAAAVLPR